MIPNSPDLREFDMAERSWYFCALVAVPYDFQAIVLNARSDALIVSNGSVLN